MVFNSNARQNECLEGVDQRYRYAAGDVRNTKNPKHNLGTHECREERTKKIEVGNGIFFLSVFMRQLGGPGSVLVMERKDAENASGKSTGGEELIAPQPRDCSDLDQP